MPNALCCPPVRADTQLESCQRHPYHRARRRHQIAIALAARPLPNFPRLRALALFSRRSSQPVVRLLRPAAENLHTNGLPTAPRFLVYESYKARSDNLTGVAVI